MFFLNLTVEENVCNPFVSFQAYFLKPRPDYETLRQSLTPELSNLIKALKSWRAVHTIVLSGKEKVAFDV